MNIKLGSIFGYLIAFPCIQALAGVLCITIGLLLRMRLEEKSLRETYPEYVEYSKRAKCIIPYVF